MDRKDFDRLLSQGKLPAVLLFEGEEEHMKQTALEALQRKFLPEGLEDLNRTVLDVPDSGQIIAAAETASICLVMFLNIIMVYSWTLIRKVFIQKVLLYFSM